MKIKLKGTINPELTILGYKPGDELEVTRDPMSKTGAANWDDHSLAVTQHCVVWPENYDIIEDDKPEPKVQFTIT